MLQVIPRADDCYSSERTPEQVSSWVSKGMALGLRSVPSDNADRSSKTVSHSCLMQKTRLGTKH